MLSDLKLDNLGLYHIHSSTAFKLRPDYLLLGASDYMFPRDTDCGGSKKIAAKESGTIMRCGFSGVSVALFEELCHRGGGL